MGSLFQWASLSTLPAPQLLRSLLIIPNSSSSISAPTDSSLISGDEMPVLRSAIHMHVIPNLAQHGPSSIRRVGLLSGLCLIVSGSRTSNIWHSTKLDRQSVLEIVLRVRSAVAGLNLMLCQPFPSRELLVVLDCSLEERDDFLVFDVLWSVARNIKSAEASSVL